MRKVDFRPYKREWFYYIDHKGLLFLEETEPKNFTSCLKDANFLDFFFDSFQINNTGTFKEYKYISPCWQEANFVRCHSFPIVFRMINRVENEWRLPYAGTKHILFDPAKLHLSEQGLLLHEVTFGAIEKSYAAFDTDLSIWLGD